jgi:hypothetical protein
MAPTVVQGVHLLAHGDKVEARQIAMDIQQYQRLLVGPNTIYGAGAYAWYPDRIPRNLQDWPQVLFEIDDKAIIDIRKRNGTSRGFFRIPGDIGSYVSVRVLAFANVW